MWRKRWAIVTAWLAATLFGLILFVHFGVDTRAFKIGLQQAVAHATGLELSIGGEARFQLVPWLGLDVADVSLKGLEGFPGEEFARVRRLGVKIKLWPLLQRKIEAEGLVLEGFELRLIRDASGRLNLQAVPVKDVRVKKDMVEVTTNKGEQVSLRYLIKSVRVADAKVTFEDRASGRLYTLDKLDLKTGAIAPGKPFDATCSFDLAAAAPELLASLRLAGAVTVRPETMEFEFDNTALSIEVAAKGLPFERGALNFAGDLRINAEKGLFGGKNLKGELRASGGALFKDPETAVFSGDVDFDLAKGTLRAPKLRVVALGAEIEQEIQGDGLLTAPRLRCALKTNAFNPRALLRRLRLTEPACRDKNALQSLAVTLTAVYENAALVVDPLRLTLDGEEFAAAASARLGEQPEYSLKLKASALDLDRYLPEPSAKTETKPAGAGAASSKQAPDLGPLKTLRADLSLELGALRCFRLKLSDVVLKATARDGLIDVAPLRASLYQGRANATAKLDARAQSPTVALDADVAGVQLQGLLTDLKGAAPLSGKATLHAALQSRGLTPEALLAGLNGKLTLALVNGAIHGFSFTPEQFISKERLVEGRGPQAKTPFESITASAFIKDGVATNNDLRAVIPPHEATGQGQIDLARMTLNYRATAHFLHLAAIPVKLTGRLDSPDVALDAGGLGKGLAKEGEKLLKDAAKNPQQLKSTVNDALNLLGGKKKK